MRKYTIDRRSLSEQVAEQLEADIISGRLGPGEQLPSERELMEQFGVGRPAVREALFYLQRLGLLEISRGTRARVIKPTPDAVMSRLSGLTRQLLANPEGQRHFQEARMLFEIGLVRYAAQHATEEDLLSLRQQLEQNRAALGDEPRFKRADVAFHAALAAIPNNPIFNAVHDMLAEWLDDRRALALQQEGVDEVALHAHTAIVDAIASGDPDAAETAMRRHLDEHYGTYRQLKERLRQQPHRGGPA